MMKVRECETDVLVIGGSAAGMRAAIEATKKGRKVLVANKGISGRSGNTIMVTGGYAAAFEGQGDHPEFHFADSLRGGEELNDIELLKTLVYQAPRRLNDLVDFGVELAADASGRPLTRKTPGHSLPRTYWGKTHIGLQITSSLFKVASGLGVTCLDHMYMSDLLLSNGRVVGALGISMKDMELVVVRAKATVLATGGAGRVYSNTNNVRGIVGDGYSMAYRAGAEMANMEFVLFHPTCPVNPKLSPLMLPSFMQLVSKGAILRNRDGEDIMRKHTGQSTIGSRDLCSICLTTEIHGGRGVQGGVYLDATGLGPNLIERDFAFPFQSLMRAGVDPRKQMFVVGPSTHAFIGGVVVTPLCETTVPGLFAAGEATTGTHGAHELPGDHLADTQVFGAIAGEQAAEWAAHVENEPFAQDTIQKHLEEIKAIEGKPVHDPATTIQDVKREMWVNVGIIRNPQGMQSAREKIDHYRRTMKDVKGEKGADILKVLELRSILDVAEMIVESALLREESRGSHYREDFPKKDNSRWLGSIVTTLGENGKCVSTFRPLRKG